MKSDFSIESEEKEKDEPMHDIDLRDNDEIIGERVQSKAARNVIPLLYVLFFFAYLDRANLGNMRHAMLDDIPMSESNFGFALGVFYISYVCFQLPANFILELLRPKKWVAIIAFTWGLVTLSGVFISCSTTLIVFRLALGIAESGFAPSLMVYIRIWFSNSYRGRIMSLFQIAIPLSAMASGIISAFIIQHANGLLGLSGWRWLFIVEGVPTVILGFFVLWFLPNSPHDAKFLNHEESNLLEKLQKSDIEQLKHSRLKTKEEKKKEIIYTLTSPRNWLLAFTGFCFILGSAGIGNYLPSILYDFGNLSQQNSNLLSSVPNFVAAVALYFWSVRSDRKQERFFHTTSALGLSVFGMILSVIFLYLNNMILFLVAITIYSIGFWSGETIFMTNSVSSVVGSPPIGIALFNCVATSGGWAGPHFLGILKDSYKTYQPGLILCTVALGTGLICVFVYRLLFERNLRVAFIEMDDIDDTSSRDELNA